MMKMNIYPHFGYSVAVLGCGEIVYVGMYRRRSLLGEIVSALLVTLDRRRLLLETTATVLVCTIHS